MKSNELLAEIKRKGMTVTEFSEKTGIPKSSLYRKLSGETCFDSKDIKDICNALDITDGKKIKDIFLS